MEWYSVESATKPETVDTTSSKAYSYARKNITEKTVTNEMTDEARTVYVYDEVKVPKEMWGLYEQLQQNSADVDYLKMMTEV